VDSYGLKSNLNHAAKKGAKLFSKVTMWLLEFKFVGDQISRSFKSPFIQKESIRKTIFI